MDREADGRTRQQLEGLDRLPISYSQHKGLSPIAILTVDPAFIVWLYENISPRRCSEALYARAKLELMAMEADRQWLNDERKQLRLEN